MPGWRPGEDLGPHRDRVDITDNGTRPFALEISAQEPSGPGESSKIFVGPQEPRFIRHLIKTNVPVTHPDSYRAHVHENGYSLDDVHLAYETFGAQARIDDTGKSNVVVVLHALTGDSHVFGDAQGHVTQGWWGPDAGSDSVIDLEEYHVICFNTLGGCQGSTGPTANPVAERKYREALEAIIQENIESARQEKIAINKGRQLSLFESPASHEMPKARNVPQRVRHGWEYARDGMLDVGEPYKSWWHPDFPVITIRDMARAQLIALNHLAVDNPAYASYQLVGGSMGAQVALEMAIIAPEKVQSLVVISGNAYTQPGQSAWHRMVDHHIRRSPEEGIRDAREVSMLLFQTFEKTNGRVGVDSIMHRRFNDRRKTDVEGWLKKQSSDFKKRFDPASLMVLHRAMAMHDIGGGARPSREWAARRIQCPVLVMGCASDILFPYGEQQELANMLQEQGVAVQLSSIGETKSNPSGHDAFLVETEAVRGIIDRFHRDVKRGKTFVPMIDKQASQPGPVDKGIDY